MPNSRRGGALCGKRGTSGTTATPTSAFASSRRGVEGKARLREEAFLAYDLTDIEAACSAG
jgi:hypothetical protein